MVHEYREKQERKKFHHMSLRSPFGVVVFVVLMKISKAQVERNKLRITETVTLHRFPTTPTFSRPRVGDSPVAIAVATLNIADPGPSCKFDPTLGLVVATATATLPWL
jgi:hypothetical protein